MTFLYNAASYSCLEDLKLFNEGSYLREIDPKKEIPKNSTHQTELKFWFLSILMFKKEGYIEL